MVFQYSDFSVLTDFLVQYMFGNTLALALFIYFAFVLYMNLSGVPIGLSLTTMTPLLMAFFIGGWLGASQWILSLSLIIIGIVFGITSIRLYSR